MKYIFIAALNLYIGIVQLLELQIGKSEEFFGVKEVTEDMAPLLPNSSGLVTIWPGLFRHSKPEKQDPRSPASLLMLISDLSLAFSTYKLR